MLRFPLNEKGRRVSDIKYIIGLDLSTVSTGVALYSIEKDKILKFDSFRSNSEDKIYIQGVEIKKWIDLVKKEYNIQDCDLLFAKEQQPLQYGKFTTISTLISIGKVHGITENICFLDGVSILDVPVATIRKTVLSDSKADKEEIFNKISGQYPEILEKKGEHDIADAIAVCYGAIPALKNFYTDSIKEKKKELKKYKSDKKLNEIKQQISNLEEMRGKI